MQKSSLGAVHITGPLEKARVNQLVLAHREEIAACYRPRMPDDPEVLRGLGLQIAVQPGGAVSSVTVANSELGSAETDECIRQAALRWQFPALKQGSEVIAGLVLQGAPGEAELTGAFVRSIVSVDRHLWAVGALGLILRREPERWVRVPNGTKRTLYSLWGSSASDLWAVGQRGTLLHFNGGAWEAVEIETKDDLFDIWGSGPRDVWVVGEGGRVMRYDGSTWRRQANPLTNVLFGVWGSGPGDVWMVGQNGVVLRWDGKGLAQLRSGLEEKLTDLYDIWGAGPDEVWAAGKGGAILRYRRPAPR